MMPKTIRQKFPLLVETFVDNPHPMQKLLNEEMDRIVREYHGLSDLDKIGAVVNDDQKNNGFKTFLTFGEKIEQMMADVVVPFAKLQRQAKNKLDVDNLLYASKAINNRILRNIEHVGIDLGATVANKKYTKQQEFWHFNDKLELEKKFDYNWGSLIAEIGKAGKIDEFSYFLIARDQVGQYERLDRMNARLKKMEDGEDKERLTKRRNDVIGYLKANESILSRKTVESVHNQYKMQFAKWSKKFDDMLRQDVELQHNVGLISNEHYKALKNSYGYAPMRRVLDDGIIGQLNGQLQISGFSVPKMRQLKGRDGGTAEIVNPLVGAIANHIETIRKGYQQLTVNRTYDLMTEFPQFAQAINAVETPINGKVTYTTPDGKPLNMDENIITKYVDGKPQAMVLSSDLVEVLRSVFRPERRGELEKFVTNATGAFVKGTTGLYTPFATINLIRDQWSAVTHTKNGYKPLIDQVQSIYKIATKRRGKTWEYMREYIALAGHQTRGDWALAHGGDMLEYLSGVKKETEGLKKWVQNLKNSAKWT